MEYIDNKVLSLIKFYFLILKKIITWRSFLSAMTFSILIVGFKNSSMFIVMIYSIIISFFISNISEKNNSNDFDALYTILAIQKNKVILAQFLFVFISNLLSFTITIFYSYLLFIFMLKPYNLKQVVSNLIICFLVSNIIQIIINCREKIKDKIFISNYLIIFTITISFYVIEKINTNNFWWIVITLSIILLIVLKIGYKKINYYYQKKDF